ncbi:MAG: segregation/condensation protein A, partial [Gemmatimonadetes bacterium]|nr:segregation/condensation protein A [Gemmatimonadota bacterium]
GRARCEVFDEGMRLRVLNRLNTENELRAGLGRGELLVEYQPLVRVADGKVVGAEALARWAHPERGLLGPGEFIEMAATLVRIKAQMLFPRRADDEEEDPRADLVRRLLEYEHFREAAELMERAERDRARYFRKGYVPVRRPAPPSEAPLDTGWDEVWEALLAMVARQAEPAPAYRFAGQTVRLEEKVGYILARLSSVSRVEFSALVSPWGTRTHAVMSLLACLELARRSALRLRQSEPFATLWVYSRDDEDADAA